MIDKSIMKSNIKDITGITVDVKIDMAISVAEAIVLERTSWTSVPDSKFYALQILALFILGNNSSVKSENLGDYSVSYQDSIPAHILIPFPKKVRYW